MNTDDTPQPTRYCYSEPATDLERALELLERPEWHERASCRGLGTELFFLDSAAGDQYRQALAVCARCPVTAECLDAATAPGPTPGIWGGTTERQRRRDRHHLSSAARRSAAQPAFPGQTAGLLGVNSRATPARHVSLTGQARTAKRDAGSAKRSTPNAVNPGAQSRGDS